MCSYTGVSYVTADSGDRSLRNMCAAFYVERYEHRVICGKNYPTRCNNIQFIYVYKLFYMFWVVSLPIIRSSYHCI